MCSVCSCKEATGRPARFALLTVPPSHRPSVRTPSNRASEHRVVAAEKLHAALRQPAREEPFLRALKPSLQKLYDLNTEIDSYPKYALSQAKTLTAFKPFTQSSSSLWKEESQLLRKCSCREVEQASERENRVRRAISRSASEHSLAERTP